MNKRLPKRQEPVKGCLAGQSRGSKTVGINPGFCGRRQKTFAGVLALRGALGQ